MLIKDECTQRIFYGVEIRENKISAAIGYDDIRKQLAVWVTRENKMTFI